MCLAADVVLIESGTTGFNGQVQVIKKVLVLGLESVTQAYVQRVKPSATIAIPRKLPKLFRFAPSEAPRVRQFIALFGPKVTFLRMLIPLYWGFVDFLEVRYSERARMMSPSSTTLKMPKMVRARK
jgi:hypothetical protein